MKRLAVIFAVAVIAPSLVLAWLALRSLRDQQFILERQQSLLCQGIADTLARNVAGVIEERQREFAAHVEALLATNDARTVAVQFDERLRADWSAAQVGFVVALTGEVLAPSLTGTGLAREFRRQNDLFLCNIQSAEVYGSWNYPIANNGQLIANSSWSSQNGALATSQQPSAQLTLDNGLTLNAPRVNPGLNNASLPSKVRSVDPQQQLVGQGRNLAFSQSQQDVPTALAQQVFNGTTVDNKFSRLASAEAEFRQIVGDATEGTVARFLQNRLNLMLWYRPPRAPDLVFGALLDLAALREQARPAVQLDPVWGEGLAVALLDETARPVAVAPAGFSAPWKRPFAATEVGEALPHWELGVYLLDPAALGRTARPASFTLALLVGVLVVAIAMGSWLIVADVKRQLALARQKTDFVSNVSHELKTPLTSIRMFAELLAEGRAAPDKQRQFLGVITAEASRLTRLINNVLDFARLDRGEKHYELRPCDLAAATGEALAGFRPHLEAAGFTLDYTPPPDAVPVRADRDALAQVIVNLLSNAEKYSNGSRSLTVTLGRRAGSAAEAELNVLDRGPGVPRGCEEKIFEQFYRAHDSLGSGIQGAGLGLTLARQIARAHGGDVTYTPRDGGGSCFTLRLPLAVESSPQRA